MNLKSCAVSLAAGMIVGIVAWMIGLGAEVCSGHQGCVVFLITATVTAATRLAVDRAESGGGAPN